MWLLKTLINLLTSLNGVGTRLPVTTIVTHRIASAEAELRRLGARIRPVPAVPPPTWADRVHHLGTFTKLRLASLVEFDKLIYLDSDVQVAAALVPGPQKHHFHSVLPACRPAYYPPLLHPSASAIRPPSCLFTSFLTVTLTAMWLQLVRNIDHLSWHPAPAAVFHGAEGFNSGVLILEPSYHFARALQQTLDTMPPSASRDGSDQAV